MGGKIFEVEPETETRLGHPAVFFTAQGMVQQPYGGSRRGLAGFFDGGWMAPLELVHSGEN